MIHPEPYVGAGTVATIRAAKARARATTAAITFADTYTCWRVNRPAGWEDSTSVETQGLVESGVGRLRPNGAGGPITGEMVIAVESPYRLRTWADALIDTGHLLVVNGARLFRVDLPKRGGAGDPLMDVYVTELFKTPLPEGA